MDDSFEMFLETVDDGSRDFIAEINDFLTGRGCRCDIKTAKSGYVVSYVSPTSKKTLANFVSRKTGMKIRIYAEHIDEYEELLDTLSPKLKKEIAKASACKRLLDPSACNSRCPMGYTFTLDGELFKKCRYMAFMLTLSGENDPYIKRFLDRELSCRGL